MSIENTRELEALKRAGRVVRLALAAMRRAVRPGVTTAELDAVCAEVLRANGARSAPRAAYGFPGHACISVNDEAVHGIPGARTIAGGDLVKLDVVAEKDGYFADAAVTVEVGVVTERRRQLAACARAAFTRAADAARAGNRVGDLSRAVQSEADRAGFRVLPGLNGHGIGRAIHEEPTVPNAYDPRFDAPLTEGMVLTVEPILVEGAARAVEDPDGWTIRTADGGFAAHHEHTLVVTRGRPILLTAA